MVSAEALGDSGRNVRCGKCGHVWFQEPKLDSLDELKSINLGDASSPSTASIAEAVVEDLSFLRSNDPKIEEKKPDPTFGIKNEKPQKKIKFGGKPKIEKPAPLWLKHVAALMVSLAITFALAYGFVAARSSVAAAVPFFNSAYIALGYTDTVPKIDMTLDRVKLARQGSDLLLSGVLINLSEQDVTLKAYEIDLLDETGKIIKTEILEQSVVLKGEQDQKLDLKLAGADPKTQSVKIRLIPQ
jgi:hypothetical protein